MGFHTKETYLAAAMQLQGYIFYRYQRYLLFRERFDIGIKDVFECFMMFLNYRSAEY